MQNKNEMIFINKILTTELTIRKAAKQFGLRRDDLIRRIKEIIADRPDLLKQLDLVIVINKMLYDNLSMEKAAEELKVTEKELDRKILSTLADNKDKLERYKEYKKPNKTAFQKEAKAFHKKDAILKAKNKNKAKKNQVKKANEKNN